MDDELYKPFKWCFSVFKFGGMWQDGEQSWTYFIVGYLAHFFFTELYIVLLLIYAYQAENLIDFVDAIGLTSTYLSETIKCLNFFYKLKVIKKCLEILKELLLLSADERFPRREHVRAQVAFSFKVYKMFWFIAWTSCSIGAFARISSHEMPYKLWFPFRTEYGSVGFWIASAYMVFDSFFSSLIDISLDIMPLIFISFAVGLINELADRLGRVGCNAHVSKVETGEKQNECVTDERNIQELIKCITIHKMLKDFVGDIQSKFSFLIFAQGLMSTIVICTGGFIISVVSSDPV